MIDRVPEELWTEPRDIVRKKLIKTIPKKKKFQKAKWLSEEVLQIAEKGREAKSKGEKERYTHLNAKLQRIARRDKKSLPQWSMQRNRGKEQNGKDQRFPQGNQRQGTFHAKMGTIKDRNGMDLTEAKD